MIASQAKLQEAQDLLSRNEPDKAAQVVAEVLQTEPDNVEALYTKAVVQRIRHEWHMAIDTLGQVLQARPNFGRAHQEIGYNHIALQNFMKAGAAFERAVNADPSLVNSWQSLRQLYKESGFIDKLKRVEEQLAFLSQLPSELLGVISYMSDDKLLDAERLCRYFLQSNKTHVEGMRLLAEIATRNNVLDDAEFLLESCVEFDPDHRNARIQYVNALLRKQKFAEAHDQASELMARFPNDLDAVRPLYASACMGVGKNDEAQRQYEQLMQDRPDNHFYPVSLAHVLKSDGNLDGAVALYRKAYEIKPDYGDAYWSLANAKSYKFTDAEISCMLDALAADSTENEDRIQISFALGKAFEDKKDFESAFEHYDRGNQLKKADTHHHEKPLQQRIDSQIEICTAELFEAKKGLGLAAQDPIFIVGLPRAGSTLLEQILSSHSKVDGTMELHNILNLAKRLRGRNDEEDGTPRYPKILTEIEETYFKRFGQQFIDDTRAYRQSAPYFIDKMPNNFFHIGLIKLILPNAKIIDARRHPMACCFSGFKQLFGEGQEFSYSLRDIGNYYRQYVKLMDHWDAVLPGFVHRVQYEDVVSDLDGEVRRLLDFCNLEFEDACVQYHKTERSIRTPSAEQVRQPIYKSGIDQWRNFEQWLHPLKDALGPEILERYPISEISP